MRFLLPAFLFASCLAFGASASTYGKQISFAPSAASAAPFAAPFMLCAFGAAASFACCAASLGDILTFLLLSLTFYLLPFLP
jgi:hypothetical protein